METFTIKDLTFTYPGKEVPAIENVSISIKRGDLVTLCGKSGCGKTTLLRNLKPAIAPHGKRTGNMAFCGQDLELLSMREQAEKIGYVFQNPDSQIVTDKVWHELAFGLENLGCDNKTIRIRAAEMAGFFGIQTWFHKKTDTLSGGQKQMLNLAAVMIMQPEVLILDEPTSQLDPIAASDFLEAVKKINREIGTTVIITEHRLEEVLPMANRMILMDKGKVLIDEKTGEGCIKLAQMKHDLSISMPTSFQIYEALQEDIGREKENCPLDVSQGRKWLEDIFGYNSPDVKNLLDLKEIAKIQSSGAEKQRGFSITSNPITAASSATTADPVITAKDVWFRYGKKEMDVIKDFSVKVEKGEFFAIVGGNGTGKTTALTLIKGLNKPYRGKIRTTGKTVLLPQNPQTVFVEKTIEKDLMNVLRGNTKEEKNKKIQDVARLTEIEDILDMHPYDVSGGEQQRAALAKVLLLEPEILLLDEPTKGMDNFFKRKLAQIFKRLKERGMTVVMVSHDIEFCGKYADKCAMFFDGNITTACEPHLFFSGNSFYTTAANKMSRRLFDNAVTAEDVILLCRENFARLKDKGRENIAEKAGEANG